jgi:hypothetical protein
MPQVSLEWWKKTDASFLWPRVCFYCLNSQCLSVSVSLNLICWLLLPRTTKINSFSSTVMQETKHDPALQVKPVFIPRYSAGFDKSSSWVFFLNLIRITNRYPWMLGVKCLRFYTCTLEWRQDCERNRFSWRNRIK